MRKIILLLLAVGFLFGTAFVPAPTYSLTELMGISRPVMEGSDFNLRPEVAKAFVEMQIQARKEGIDLHSLSSYRSYNHQLRIWNRKWTRYEGRGMKGLAIINKIIEYSTIPGTSRHHWGTDLDVIDNNVKVYGDKLLGENYEKGGVYEKLGAWLRENAESFGFYLVYTKELTRQGFSYEPWHLSYKKLSQPMLKSYLSQDWRGSLKNIKGYQFMDKQFLDKYAKENIQSINPDLL